MENNNINEGLKQLKRSLLLMKYDSKKTLSENVVFVGEQQNQFDPNWRTKLPANFAQKDPNVKTTLDLARELNKQSPAAPQSPAQPDPNKWPKQFACVQKIPNIKLYQIEEGSQPYLVYSIDDQNIRYHQNGLMYDPKTPNGKRFYCEGDKVKIKLPYVWKETPFRTKQDGDAFRAFMNKEYLDFSKKMRLDPSGSHNNWYIKKAYESKIPNSDKTYGQYYFELIQNNTPLQPKPVGGVDQTQGSEDLQPQSRPEVSTSSLGLPQGEVSGDVRRAQNQLNKAEEKLKAKQDKLNSRLAGK